MKIHTLLAAFAVLVASLLAAPAALAAEAYVIDPVHTSVVFSVSHTELSYTYGFFRKAQGSYILDDNPANCRFRFAIQADSLDTNSTERDTHLKGPDFFNVVQYPAISFDSTSVTRLNTTDGSTVYQVTGTLSMHGETKSITLPQLRLLGKGKGLQGDQRSGFLTQIELKRSDFGMNKLLNIVGDAVGITVSFEGSLDPNARTQ